MTDRGRLEPRLAFYARHQELIEEWLGVRGDFRRRANKFYRKLPIRGPAETKLEEGQHKARGREWRWVSIEKADGVWKGAALRLEWNDKTTFATGHLRIGIWIGDYEGEEGLPALNELSNSLHTHDPEMGWKGDGSRPWLIYLDRDQMPRPREEYWNDLGGFGSELATFVSERWGTLAKALDALFNERA